MLRRIENINAQTAEQLLSVLPQDFLTAFTLFALLDWCAVDGAWVQSDEKEQVTALVVQKDQTKAYVSAGKNADFEELALFLRHLGGLVIYCTPEFTARLGVTPFSRHSFMVLSETPEPGKKAVSVIDTNDLRPVFDLLIQSARAAAGDSIQFQKHSERAFQEWLSRTSRGMLGGYTAVKAVYAAKNALLSAAVADTLGKFVYIRDVATDRDYRKMGYGSDCVRGLCADLKQADNQIFLLCDDLKTERFYQKTGFVRQGSVELGIVEL